MVEMKDQSNLLRQYQI